MTGARFSASRSHFSSRLGALLLAASAVLACKITVGQAPDGNTVEPGAVAGSARPPAVDPEIDAIRMLADLELLAGDEFAGRYTFSEHLGLAADHLAAQYREIEIEPVGPDYRVPFMAPAGSKLGDELTLWAEDAEGVSRQVPGKKFETLGNGDGEAAYAEVVAVRSLQGAKASRVSGKIVVAPAPPADRLVKSVEAFVELDAAGLVLLGEGSPPDASQTLEAFNELMLPIAWIDAAAAKEWMGVDARGKRAPVVPKGMKMSMAAKREKIEKEVFNVVAFIPGTTTPEEIVILGAHYDHIGTSDEGVMCRPQGEDTICNGADDNASGTAMVLEVARSFREAHIRPARTIVFAHFAAEELGLHGSKALANEPPELPPFVGGKVVAMVNLDMVGRLGEKGLAIGGVSSSDAWMPLLEGVAPDDLPIVYERAINARSDHASFYRHKVPVLFLFTGLHDDYHQAGDHFEKINREGMEEIAQMVAELTLELTMGYELPYAAPRTEEEGVVSRLPGADEATVEKRSGPGKGKKR